jgi:hypothetical protein
MSATPSTESPLPPATSGRQEPPAISRQEPPAAKFGQLERLRNDYPVWRSLQRYINGAALSLTLSSEDFEETFLQKDRINATHILNLFDQVAMEAVAIVQYGHTQDSKDSVLESVPTEGKNSTHH